MSTSKKFYNICTRYLAEFPQQRRYSEKEKKDKGCFEKGRAMRLCHPPDGSTSPKYKLLCFKPP
jgi:hypothetical protein